MGSGCAKLAHVIVCVEEDGLIVTEIPSHIRNNQDDVTVDVAAKNATDHEFNLASSVVVHDGSRGGRGIHPPDTKTIQDWGCEHNPEVVIECQAWLSKNLLA